MKYDARDEKGFLLEGSPLYEKIRATRAAARSAMTRDEVKAAEKVLAELLEENKGYLKEWELSLPKANFIYPWEHFRRKEWEDGEYFVMRHIVEEREAR